MMDAFGNDEEIGYAQAIGPPVHSRPTCSMRVTITKVDNGYVLTLTTPHETIKPGTVPPPVDEAHVDLMVDGLVAIFRKIGKAGEEWNGEGEGDKDRLAIHKALSLYATARGPTAPEVKLGRSEQHVFRDKKELLAFIEEEL